MAETAQDALHAVIDATNSKLFWAGAQNVLPGDANRAYVGQAAGYIPSSVADYAAAVDKFTEYFYYQPDFWKWKTANLRTPEQMIQAYWGDITSAATSAAIPPDVLAGVLLNEMRAFQHEDMLNDMVAGETSIAGTAFRVANDRGWTDSMPSIGVAQLRPDTILVRGLLGKMTWPNGYAAEQANGAPAQALTDRKALTKENFEWFNQKLADPATCIQFQAAHIKMMMGLINGATWGLPDGGGYVPVPGASLINPKALTAAQAKVVTDTYFANGMGLSHQDALARFGPPKPDAFGRLVVIDSDELTLSRSDILATSMVANNGYNLRSQNDVASLVLDGSFFLCLLGMYIDEKDEKWRDAAGNPMLKVKPFWGMGIAEAAKDVRQFILNKNPPDWKTFTDNRKVYDEVGYYGPKGQTLSIIVGAAIPKRWWEKIY